jgi:hypothetical protein
MQSLNEQGILWCGIFVCIVLLGSNNVVLCMYVVTFLFAVLYHIRNATR